MVALNNNSVRLPIRKRKKERNVICEITLRAYVYPVIRNLCEHICSIISFALSNFHPTNRFTLVYLGTVEMVVITTVYVQSFSLQKDLPILNILSIDQKH